MSIHIWVWLPYTWQLIIRRSGANPTVLVPRVSNDLGILTVPDSLFALRWAFWRWCGIFQGFVARVLVLQWCRWKMATRGLAFDPGALSFFRLLSFSSNYAAQNLCFFLAFMVERSWFRIPLFMPFFYCK